MSFFTKKNIAMIVLILFLSGMFFGFVSMTHESVGSMTEGCPFSGMEAPLCPQGLLALTVHHISSVYSFLNVTISLETAFLLLGLFFMACFFKIFFAKILYKANIFLKRLFDKKPRNLNNRKAIRWLSLFENSPATY